MCGGWSVRLLAVKQSAHGHNIPYGRQFVIQTSCAYVFSGIILFRLIGDDQNVCSTCNAFKYI